MNYEDQLSFVEVQVFDHSEINLAEAREISQENFIAIQNQEGHPDPIKTNEVQNESKKRKRSTNTGTAKKTRASKSTTGTDDEPRFTVALDIQLLTEVLSLQPFLGSYKEKAEKWKAVKSNLNVSFDVGSLRRRYQNLLEKYREEEMKSLKSSGTDEEKTTRASLLAEIKQIVHDFTLLPSAEAAKKNDDKKGKAIGEDIREKAMQDLKEKRSSSPESSPQRGGKKKNILELIQGNQQEELEFRKIQFDFEKEKYEKELHERRLDREMESRRLAIMEQSQKDSNALMMAIVQSLNK